MLGLLILVGLLLLLWFVDYLLKKEEEKKACQGREKRGHNLGA